MLKISEKIIDEILERFAKRTFNNINFEVFLDILKKIKQNEFVNLLNLRRNYIFSQNIESKKNKNLKKRKF